VIAPHLSGWRPTPRRRPANQSLHPFYMQGWRRSRAIECLRQQRLHARPATRGRPLRSTPAPSTFVGACGPAKDGVPGCRQMGGAATSGVRAIRTP
jgi:hypothetical protein